MTTGSTMTSDRIPDSVRNALRRSGFPLQTALAARISNQGRFSVRHAEYPWRDQGGEDRFLDLIVLGPAATYAIIECKKTQEEWTFLRPLGVSNERDDPPLPLPSLRADSGQHAADGSLL